MGVYIRRVFKFKAEMCPKPRFFTLPRIYDCVYQNHESLIVNIKDSLKISFNARIQTQVNEVRFLK